MVASRMLKWLLVVATASQAGAASCGSSSIRCSSSTKCVVHSDLCDGAPHCPGGEDEETAWCAMYSKSDTFCTTKGQTSCGQTYNCMAVETACGRHCSPYAPSTEVCTAINNDILPAKQEEPDIAPQIDIRELVSFMSTANCSLEKTSTLTNQTSNCPQLYISIGNLCVAPLPFALTWPEALIACQSISGKLFEVEFVETFAEVVQFLIKADFTTNFWIGGFYDIEKEDWAWGSGPRMPRSTPYWAVKHNITCVTRQSTTLGALPGCSHYQQAPTNHGTGYCAALQYEYMYYISDEGCFQKKQPICIH